MIALQSFSSFDRKEVSEELISRWNGFGPAVRVEVLDALLSHRDRVPALLDAVESGRIERGALDLPRREKLLRNPDFKISARARQILREEPSDRTQVLQAYRPALDLAGDAVKGNVIFEKNCAICHLARKGRRVGPDLSGVSSKTKAQLLEDILNPSKSIQAAYTNYVVITRDGVIHDGLVAAETPGTRALPRDRFAGSKRAAGSSVRLDSASRRWRSESARIRRAIRERCGETRFPGSKSTGEPVHCAVPTAKMKFCSVPTLRRFDRPASP